VRGSARFTLVERPLRACFRLSIQNCDGMCFLLQRIHRRHTAGARCEVRRKYRANPSPGRSKGRQALGCVVVSRTDPPGCQDRVKSSQDFTFALPLPGEILGACS
jgi:hypothetical protein